MKLQIANNLSLPVEVITQKLAFLGITGSGKTYAAGKLAELLLGAGAQVVILDNVGNWWGLRLSADGKGKGYDIPIIGGLKGDIPLEPTAGAIVADMLVDRGISAVIDVSQFIPSELHKFGLAFAARLFQRRKERPAAMHLIIEESQEFAPQNATEKGDEPKMLRAFERLIKLGRNFGIGASLLSQRPQEINKKVLNMASTIFAFNMIGKQERDAMKAWLRSNLSGAEEIVETLASLEIGTAHVFSPGFLKVNQTARILPKTTYDGSATPDFQTARKEAARPLTPIDLEELRGAMAATIEKAKADDPKLLRQRIAELERELKRPKPAEIDKSVIDAAVEAGAQKWKQAFEKAEREYQAIIGDLKNRLLAVAQAIGRVDDLPAVKVELPPTQKQAARQPTPRPSTPTQNRQQVIAGNGSSSEMSKAERAVLSALAQYPQGRTKPQLGILSGYSHTSGGFNSTLASLRAKGWIDGLRIMQQGIEALGEFEPLPTGDALVNYWLNRLTGCPRALLDKLTTIYPRSISREELAEVTGYSGTSGGFNSALAELRTLELITKGREIKASDVFFE